jgi:DNA/RNA-binding domain of Phe-tRNA-synthetase-like protein
VTDAALRAGVAPEVADRHPDYVAAVLVVEGIPNGPSDEASRRALRDAEERLRARGLARPADHPHIASWRAAFSAFGAKPSKYRCSAEALAARVLKGDRLPEINRLVDIYNAVSVTHLVPLGGEDLDRLQGPLRLVVAAGDESFETAADGAPEHPRPGEIVWRDDLGVTCRRWNWRQGSRTRLEATSHRAFFVFDRLSGLTLGELDAAVEDVEDRLRSGWPACTSERLVIGDA